jgi:hypothetical protein
VPDGEALWAIDRGAPLEGVVTFRFDLLHVEGEDLLDRSRT